MTLVTSWSLSSSEFSCDKQPAFQLWYEIRIGFLLLLEGDHKQLHTLAQALCQWVSPGPPTYTAQRLSSADYFWAATHIHTAQVNTHLWTLILQRSQQHLSEGGCKTSHTHTQEFNLCITEAH